MRRLIAGFVLLSAMVLTAVGCRSPKMKLGSSPAEAGINTRDVVDLAAQKEAEELNPPDQLAKTAERIRLQRQQKLEESAKARNDVASIRPDRNVLCLSGGGSFGAYSAGVLVGWTERGDRPTFDVVTGISTGGLIAPCAVLGPKYDAQMQKFYTSVRNKDIYRTRRFYGLFDESFADTAPLKLLIEAFLTPELIAEIAQAHLTGRRLYIGTTEEEGRQFVVWDLGAMAVRGRPIDRDLMVAVLLGSAAAPGIFPSSKIAVTIDGVRHVERHVDGGVSQALFYRPPYTPPEHRSATAANDLANTKVYTIVAGKIYADPEVIRPWSIIQAGKNISTIIYAQTRGDLHRLYTLCLLTGMDYFVTAIPPEYPAGSSSSEFDPVKMTALLEEGRRVIRAEKPWRTLPPGGQPGETVLERFGTELNFRPRGPALPISGPKGTTIPVFAPISDKGGMPAGPLDLPLK